MPPTPTPANQPAPGTSGPLSQQQKHVRTIGATPQQNDVRVPLRIQFLDPVAGIKLGKEIRFEVVQSDGKSEVKVEITRLDFSFAPIVWGEVRGGANAFMGVVRVVSIHKPADIYDRPKYDMLAMFKAQGGTSVETVHRFALGIAAPVVELLFYLKPPEEPFEAFRPQEQRQPLDPRRDITLEPAGAAEIFAEGKRLFLRLLKPGAKPRVTVRFPNEETATLEIDLRRAGEPPSETPAALEPEPTPDAAPPLVAREQLPPREPPPAPAGDHVHSPARLPAPDAVTASSAALAAVNDESEGASIDDALDTLLPDPAPMAPRAPTPTPIRSEGSRLAAAAALAEPIHLAAPARSAAPAPAVAKPGTDPTAGLRAELASFQREVERVRQAGAFASEELRLKKRAETLRKYVQSYVGPDAGKLQEALAATIRATGM